MHLAIRGGASQWHLPVVRVELCDPYTGGLIAYGAAPESDGSSYCLKDRRKRAFLNVFDAAELFVPR